MKRFVQLTFAACLALASLAASFPYVTLNNKTNRLSDNGSALTFNGSAIGGGSITTNAPAIAAGSIAAFASSNVLGAATSAQLQSALGNLYQATNANLTLVAAGGGIAANWNASGSTNSTLAGMASASSGFFTNSFSGGGFYNVRDFGAVGNGTNSDTVAIQAAIDYATTAGSIVFIPPGIYKITNSLTLRRSTHLMGVNGSPQGMGYVYTNYTSVIDARSFTGSFPIAINTGGSGTGQILEDFTLIGPTPGGTTIGIRVGTCQQTMLRNVYVLYFAYGIDVLNSGPTFIENCQFQNCTSYAMHCNGCTYLTSIGGLYANSGVNIFIENNAHNLIFLDGGIDEASTYSVDINAASDISFVNTHIFTSPTAGMRIGTGASYATRVTLDNVRFEPFGAETQTNALNISSAVDTRLINVSHRINGTNTSIITDNGTNTVWFNVNGQYKQPGFSSVLSSNTASTLFYSPVANTNRIGGDLVWEAFATDGTDTQAQSGRSHFDAVAKTTTVTAGITSYTNTAVVSTGTFTVLLSANTTTNNVCAIQATVTPSLNTTNIVFRWRVDSPLNFTLNPL